MKKVFKFLIGVFLLCSLPSLSYAVVPAVNCNNLVNAGMYSLPESAVKTNCGSLTGTAQLSVMQVKNGGVRPVISQYVINDNAVVASRTRNESLVWSSWALSTESQAFELALPNTQLFIGDAGGIAQPHAMSGAMTISNTGVTTPTTASFWTTPSAGNQNNVLTGVQQRYCSAVMPIIAAGATANITCTYGTAFTTGDYAVTVTPVEPTAGLTIETTLTSHSTTGFVVKAHNASDVASQAGTVLGIAVGH